MRAREIEYNYNKIAKKNNFTHIPDITVQNEKFTFDWADFVYYSASDGPLSADDGEL